MLIQQKDGKGLETIELVKAFLGQGNASDWRQIWGIFEDTYRETRRSERYHADESNDNVTHCGWALALLGKIIWQDTTVEIFLKSLDIYNNMQQAYNDDVDIYNAIL
jgi:hypothetical protein